MLRAEDFELEALITAAWSQRAFRGQLTNGHQLVVHASRRTRVLAAGLRVGDRVRIRVTPADLSKGRLIEGCFEKNGTEA